jgi:hypothetical protein
MRAFLFFIGFVLINSFWGGLSCAFAKSTAPLAKMQLVNDKLWMYHEEGTGLTAEDIFLKYKQNALTQNTAGQVSYGFTPNTIWGVLAVDLNTYGVLDPNNGSNSSQDD